MELVKIETHVQAIAVHTVIGSLKTVIVSTIDTLEKEVTAVVPLQPDQNLQLIQALEVAQKEIDPLYQTRGGASKSAVATELRNLMRYANETNNSELHEHLQQRMLLLSQGGWEGPQVVQSDTE